MDRQTLRDWVHRFNASGPEGLIDHWTVEWPRRLPGRDPSISASLMVTSR
jgi:hypothetical protein